MLSLAAPWWLFVLPLPWLVWWGAARRRNHSGGREAALLHPQAELLARLSEQRPPRLPWLWLLACCAMIVALSRPQWLNAQHPGRNFLLTLDVSTSMAALDFTIDQQPANRLAVLKHAVTTFLHAHPKDRIGMVVFADDAYTLAPLTTDHRLLRRFLHDVELGMAGDKTALGEAVALGVQRLRHHDARSRILMLFSDGAQSAGEVSPEQALAYARHHGVRIYAIGIGSHGRVPFPRGPLEPPEFKEVPLDEAVLQRFAQETGGRYFRAAASAELMDIIAAIEALETVPIEADSATPPRDLYLAPLALALGLGVASVVVGQRRVTP